MLMRRDRDYSILSALSQEIGRMRQRIRADLREGRNKRDVEKAARRATPELSAAEEERAMKHDDRSKVKLPRVLRNGTFAMITAWSLLALAIYALLGAVSEWLAADTTADGWIAWIGRLVDQSGGIVVGILWLAGTLTIFAAMAAICPHAA